jgi:hypothetical protein
MHPSGSEILARRSHYAQCLPNLLDLGQLESYKLPYSASAGNRCSLAGAEN